MKKIAALLLTVVMVLSLCTGTAFAKDGPMPTNPQAWGGARIGFSYLAGDKVAYVVFDWGSGVTVNNEAFAGATYDKTGNTLTLKDCDASDYSLFIWYMGDDFKLRVEGSCKVGIIYVVDQFGLYNTNLSIIGSGTLTVNEAKENGYAVSIWSEGDGNPVKLSIASTVTVHMYSGEGLGYDGEAEDTVIRIMGSTIVKGSDVMTAGGKPIEGVTSERVYNTEYDEANVYVVRDRTGERTNGYVAKSKSDPDGKYSVNFWGESDSRYVTHYVWADSIGLWVADPTFGGYGEQKTYTKEEFEKEYTIEQSSQPTKIRFTTDEREQNKGWSVFLLKKDGEPGEVYGGSPIWGSEGSSRDNPDSYTIYHLSWDAEQSIYVKDDEFPYTNIDADKLESNGYSFVTEDVVQNKTFRCWANSAPYDDDNWQSTYDVISCKSDPDGLYVQTGESYTEGENGERTNEKIIVEKVLYDEENEVYYVTGEYSNYIYVPLDEIGKEYSYVTETVTVKKEVRYIDSDYGFDDYSYEALLLSKDGEDTIYGAEPYLDRNNETMYSVHKMELRENGHYYAIKWRPSDSAVYAHDMTLEDMKAEGLSFVNSMQDTPFTIIGDVDFLSVKKYTDSKGKLYAVDWDNNVYRYAEDDSALTFGETTYYCAVPSNKKVAELISTEREVPTDCYNHYLHKKEYHFEGTGAAGGYWIGDVNNDGAVKNRDALILDRYIAGWKNYDQQIKNWDAADLNRDGQVKNRDALMLDRYIAGWASYQKYVFQVNG